MKKITLMLGSAMLLLISCNSSETKGNKTDSTATNISTSEVKTGEAWVPVDSAARMKAMQEYGTTGKMHELLASWDGTWTGESTIWEYEGATPMKSMGTAVNSMILGGHYQSTTHTGDMMGMKFEGRSITGYDNATKQFVSTWIDNWSTGIMNMTGTWNESSKTLNMTGSMPDITRPGKLCTLREVFTVVDENTQKMEMFGPDPNTGKEFKMMEINMKRKK